MKSNLLQEKIYQIQNEYKCLLETLSTKIESNFSSEILDEIDLFWYQHIKEIKLFLKIWITGNNDYIFTTSTYIDFKNNDHLPFLLLGDKHIFDDPLGKYSKIYSKAREDKSSDFIKEEMKKSITSNLNLLNNAQNEIIILPITLIWELDYRKEIDSIAEAAFTSLFVDIKSIDDYFSKCSSYSDIIKHAQRDIASLIKFSENDDMSLSFEERFRKAIKDSPKPVDINELDSYNFFMLLIGRFIQAFNVISICSEYGLIPYVRNSVTLYYILLFSSNIKDEKLKKICFKMFVANYIYNNCDLTVLSKNRKSVFLKIIKECDFYNRLYSCFDKENINENNYSIKQIVKIINKELDRLYQYL